MLAIENGTVYAPEGPIGDGMVLVEDGTIRAVGPRRALWPPASADRLDAKGAHIAPGFVDMHMHGALDHEMLHATRAGLEAITTYLPAHGVTSFVPSTVAAPLDDILESLRLARSVLAGPRLPGAEILGVHLEGPYLDREMRGAHRADIIRDPNPDETAALLAYADVITSVTLAPERPGALELTRALAGKGILVSAGHTLAIDRDIERAIEAGLSHVTHLYGNMASLRRENLTRVAGLVETALLDDRLTAEIIGDGYHIAPSLWKLAYKAKSADRLAIVTDASPLMGLPPGAYHRWGMDVMLEERCSYLADRTAFAGSVVPMDRCLSNTVHVAQVPLGDALRMVTATPARILGVDRRKGSLAPGQDGDVVILDSDLQVTHTIVGGRLFYSMG